MDFRERRLSFYDFAQQDRKAVPRDLRANAYQDERNHAQNAVRR
jgi:hypothetical protein